MLFRITADSFFHKNPGCKAGVFYLCGATKSGATGENRSPPVLLLPDLPLFDTFRAVKRVIRAKWKPVRRLAHAPNQS